MPSAGPARNIHATALILGDRGLLIAGPSGSGKTTLALALVAEAMKSGRFARLVADDQVFVESSNGRLVANTPGSIAGLVEIRGLGPQSVPFEPAAVIDVFVALVPRGDRVRLPAERDEQIEGVRLPRLELAAHDTGAAVLAVAAHLRLPPFAI